jgi:hypothetical protein
MCHRAGARKAPFGLTSGGMQTLHRALVTWRVRPSVSDPTCTKAVREGQTPGRCLSACVHGTARGSDQEAKEDIPAAHVLGACRPRMVSIWHAKCWTRANIATKGANARWRIQTCMMTDICWAGLNVLGLVCLTGLI